MARILGVLGTKICYSIVKNMDTNGPLEFRTVLYSKHSALMSRLAKYSET